jgi:CDP-diacylglycerol pyrophosphatase
VNRLYRPLRPVTERTLPSSDVQLNQNASMVTSHRETLPIDMSILSPDKLQAGDNHDGNSCREDDFNIRWNTLPSGIRGSKRP